MPWICPKCSYNFGWNWPKTKKGTEYKRCPKCYLSWLDFDVEDFDGFKHHHSLKFHPIEGKATDEQLKGLSKIYSERHNIPIEICEEFFLKVCHTSCSSGHYRGMCIHNLECLENLLTEKGFL
jgi:hypothetical protein